jgi:RNA polymerase sigma-70 factor (ECF subfamily)
LSVTDSTAQTYIRTDPDVQLMLQVRDDSAVAFEELVSRYQGRLLTVFRHLVGSREQAEDLAQEVFLRVFRARKRYQPGAKFSTWLFTIANNVASNARRTLSRRREVGVPLGSNTTSLISLEQMAKEASGLMPSRQLDDAETAEVVRLAVQSLNPRQRMAVLLCKFEGMSYVDIAESMDMTPQAVKSLLSRARGNLRTVLEPYVHRGDISRTKTSDVKAGEE